MNSANKGDDGENGQRNPSGLWPLLVDVIRGYSASQRAEEKKTEYAIARKVAKWTKITGIGTIIAAVLAAVAAAAFWSQLWEQRADFRLDQRPILALSTFPPGTKIDIVYHRDTGQLYWNYVLKNYGKGTAFHIRIFDYISITNGNFRGRPKGPGEGTLVPTKDEWSTAYYPSPVTNDAFDSAWMTDGGIITKIIVKYKDVYGTIYEDHLCLAHNSSGSVANCDLTYIKIPTEGDSAEADYK